MKYLAVIVFTIVILLQAAARADECTRYVDSDYQYSICAPDNWKNTYKKDGDRHYMTFRHGRSAATEISVTASPVVGEEIPEGNDWKTWHSRSAGSGFRKIIETKELVFDGSIRVKVVLFDYYSRGVRMLQRTMLSRYGNSQVVIECRAPLRYFGTSTDIFNMVMSSVDYSGTMTGKAMDELDEEKTVPRKQPEPKKKAEPKNPAGNVKRPEPKEKKSDTGLNKKQDTARDVESGMGAGSRKGGEVDVDIESIKDPEARKIIEKELNTLQDLEQKGLIEKVDEEK